MLAQPHLTTMYYCDVGYKIRKQERVATALIRGYWYQALHTVAAWLRLDDNSLLIAEGNEDIDRVLLDSPSATKFEESIKFRSNLITQGSPVVVDTIRHYLAAFVYHHREGNQFRGILRTNAQIATIDSTEIGSWISGHKTEASALAIEIQAIAVGKPSLLPDLTYIERNNLWPEFLESVEWAPASGNLEQLRIEILQLLEARAPTVSSDVGQHALLVTMMTILTQDELEKRILRRIDADLVLNDVILNTLTKTQLSAQVPERVVLTWTKHPHAQALVLVLPNSKKLKSSVDRALREARVRRTVDESATMLKQLVDQTDFLAYAAFREQSGPRGTRVCVKSVIRQSSYRHSPREVFIPRDSPGWVGDCIRHRWPNATLMSPLCPNSTEAILSAFVAQAVANRDLQVLKSIDTKLRWVQRLDDQRYFTVEQPLWNDSTT